MKTPTTLPLSHIAVLALAEIKAAVEAFDKGETNAFDALDAITAAVDACRPAEQDRREAA